MNSLGNIYLALGILIEQSAHRYAYISKKQNANEDHAVPALFKQLADQEYSRLEVIRQKARDQPENTGTPAKTSNTPEPIHTDQRSGLVYEATESPYLLKPYRALQLAVNDKLWVFEYITRMASMTEDPATRRIIENLALEELELISRLRKKRRLAYRQEKSTPKLDFLSDENDTLSSPQDLDNFLADANTVICAMAHAIEHSWIGELPKHTAVVLMELRQTLSAQTEPQTYPSPFAEHQNPQEADLFSPMRILLRELEATCNMALKIADLSHEEQVVRNAQNAAKTYVELLAMVHAEVDCYAPAPGTRQ